MLIFATLGPGGSNHEWVARRYLAFHGLTDARVALFEDFDTAFDALLGEEVQHLVQAAVHPDASQSVARHRTRAHLIDVFLSPSQPMAVLTRRDVRRPASLGLQPATLRRQTATGTVGPIPDFRPIYEPRKTS